MPSWACCPRRHLPGDELRDLDMMEYPIARAYAAARVNKLYGGTSEIMKEVISRTL